jgi:hypothetical protein
MTESDTPRDVAAKLAVMLNSGRWNGAYELIQTAIQQLRRLDGENRNLKRQIASAKRRPLFDINEASMLTRRQAE